MDVAALQRRLELARPHLRKSARRASIAILVMVGVIVLIRVILDPIATHFTRRGLEQLEGYRGEFQRVHVTIFSPGYEITRVKLWEHPGGSAGAPLFYAERVGVSVDWRRLLHGDLVGRARIEQPKITIVNPAAPRPKARAKAEAPDLAPQLQKITALKVDRVEVLRGEVTFRDLAEAAHPQLWLHGLDLVAENLATRPGLARGRPSTVSGHGTLGDSGDVSLFVSADPFARPLAFAGRFELRGLRAAELYAFTAPQAKLQTPRGTIDLFAEFVSRDGAITGGVKPVLKNVEVRPTESGIGDRLKAWAADESLKLFSDRVAGRNAVTTVVPIKGRLTNPDVQLWPTILGVIRNAFVEGLASGFAHLPPPVAEKHEGVLEQAKKALQKNQGPPKAQPPTAGAPAHPVH
jgi:Domain of Unknown Function (DUF748)